MEAEKIANVWKRELEPTGEDIPMPTPGDIDNYRAAIRTFKRHTAMSHDMTKPHDYANLTDAALGALITLFRRCEKEGRWPEAWRNPCLVCIPKEQEGEFRLIALLHYAYRVWAKEAAREGSQWMSNLGRDWIAFGPGCAAEDAAYDILSPNGSCR